MARRAAAVLVACAALAGCGGSSGGGAPQGPPAATIVIQEFRFTPPAVTVHSGSTVRFVNQGAKEHSAVATAGGFDTGKIRPGGSASITVGTIGTATYKCGIHPWMTGQIVIVQ